MVLSINGLGSQLALNLIDSTKERQLQSLRNEPAHARAEAAFRERIGSITTPEELIKDYEVYSFVMSAFDLEDQIFGKGMMRKILESDPSDETSLVNRLTDGRFGEIHASLAFVTSSGPQIPNFSDPAWQDAIVDRYYNRVFINENDAQNETVGTVLHFREEVGEINNWYDVLKDTDLAEFFRVALNLPEEMAAVDVDIQKRELERRYDLSKLSDPAEQERLMARYVAISDVLNPPQWAASSMALSVLQNASLGGQFVPATINLPTISYSAASLYR
jgi:hypothetical protein